MTNHGKWSDPGVPHKGWSAFAVHEGDDLDFICEMCEEQPIHWIHIMTHPEHETLSVGNVCADNMAHDYDPKQAVQAAKTKRAREAKARFLKILGERHILQSRYAGRCRSCREPFAEGDLICWRREPTSSVICVGCIRKLVAIAVVRAGKHFKPKSFPKKHWISKTWDRDAFVDSLISNAPFPFENE